MSIWKPPLRRLTIGLVLTVVATAFEALAVATVLPVTLHELGGLAYYGWTFSAFMLSNLVGICLGAGGRLLRSFGAGAVLFCAGLAISGCAPSMLVIVLGRLLQGFGAGLLSTVAYAAIAQAYTVELQPRVLATLSSAWVVPGLIGPGLAGLIAQHASWRWVFLGLIPLLLIATGLVLPALRALPFGAQREQSGRVSLSIQLGLGAGAALAGLGERNLWLAIVLAAVGGGVALRALSRLLPAGTLLARPGLPAAVASMALITFAFFGAEAFLPLALSDVRHAPVTWSGLALTAAALTWTAGAWLPVRLAGRAGRRTIVRAGLAILGLGLLATLAVLDARVPPAAAMLAWGVAGFGMGLAFTTTSAAILEAAGPGEAGLASSSLQLAQVLGAALATGAGGAIVAAPFAGDPPMLGIASVDILMLSVTALALYTARGIKM